jgi:hypothetical protein
MQILNEVPDVIESNNYSLMLSGDDNLLDAHVQLLMERGYIVDQDRATITNQLTKAKGQNANHM